MQFTIENIPSRTFFYTEGVFCVEHVGPYVVRPFRQKTEPTAQPVGPSSSLHPALDLLCGSHASVRNRLS